MIDSTKNTIHFNGRIATKLSKKLSVAADTKIPGSDDLILTGLEHSYTYNRYKNGINHKAKSFRDHMEAVTSAIFYNKSTPEIITEVKINNSHLDTNAKILDYITPEVTSKAEAELDNLHKLNALF